MKYKCKNPLCGHIFNGDYSTNVCPQCGGSELEMKKNGAPIKKILIGAGIIVVLIVLLKLCSGGEKQISLSMNENKEAKLLTFKVEGLSKNELKANYKIMVYDSNSAQIDQIFFNGKGEEAYYPTEQLTANECYTFNFVSKNGSNINLRWKSSNQYCVPAPPVAPVITCSKTVDCTSGTYTIIINIESGNVKEYYLDDIKQMGGEIRNVAPRQAPYSVQVCDENGLMSDVQLVYCTERGVQSFHITEAEIQAEFNRVSSGSMYAGNAMEKISRGRNIKLTTSIDGCSTLEEALNYAYNMGQRYRVKAQIDHNDCTDVVRSITLTH